MDEKVICLGPNFTFKPLRSIENRRMQSHKLHCSSFSQEYDWQIFYLSVKKDNSKNIMTLFGLGLLGTKEFHSISADLQQNIGTVTKEREKSKLQSKLRLLGE